MKRLVWIDDAKAIGIFLVILAHTQIWGSVTDWISVFRMPLFFFLSGYLFSFQRNSDGKLFARKRFKQIVIPYFFINIITYLFWLLVSSHYGVSADEQLTPWYGPIVAALLCNGKDMVHNIPLWFLLCLFLVEMVYYVVYRRLCGWQRWLATISFGLLGYINYKYIPFVLPFSMGTAFVGMMFYFLGNEVAQMQQKITIAAVWKPLLLLCSAAVVTCFSVTNERVYLYCNHYGNYLLFIVAALCGIMMMYIITDYISRWLGENKVMTYISRNTLTICGFHLMSYTLLKGVAVFVFKCPLELFSGTVWLNVLLAATGMAVCCLIAYFLNRFMPFILGK